MSLREDVKELTVKIVAGGKDIDEKIVGFVKSDYSGILASCKKSNRSVKKATRDILKGIEEGFKIEKYNGKKTVKKVAAVMLRVSRRESEKEIRKSHKAAVESKIDFMKELDKVNDNIDRLKAKTKNSMKKRYAKLQKKAIEETAHFKNTAAAITEHAVKEENALLHKVAMKSKRLVIELETSLKKKSGELLEHGEAKVSKWLGKL